MLEKVSAENCWSRDWVTDPMSTVDGPFTYAHHFSQTRQLQEDKADLERQVTELTSKCEQIKPREAERCVADAWTEGDVDT